MLVGIGFTSLLTGQIVAGAVLFHLQESEAVTLADALWWAAVTVTTVGYGDISPASTTGRAVALIVMLVGIGFTSLLTGQIAGFLASDGSDDVTSELKALREEVAGLRREVRRLDVASAADSTRVEALEDQEVGQADPVEGRGLQSVGQGSEPSAQPG